jgi:hypothetical protein
MSLINEALKKAQRARHGGTEPTPVALGGVERREQPRSAKSTLLLAAGAIVLVVLSIVVTALWLNRPSKPATVATTKVSSAGSTTAPETSTTDVAPSKPTVVSLPPLSPLPDAAKAAPTAKATTAASSTPETPPLQQGSQVASLPPAPPVAGSPILPAPTTLPASTATTPGPEPAAPTGKPDERIHQFVESIRVTGIRASGGDSKVLMNDRVYRVNDLVERTLGVRLTKVANDSLTFTDSNGVTYVKYF